MPSYRLLLGIPPAFPSSGDCHIRRQRSGTKNSRSQPQSKKKAASDRVYCHTHSISLFKKSLRTSPRQEKQAGSLHPHVTVIQRMLCRTTGKNVLMLVN